MPATSRTAALLLGTVLALASCTSSLPGGEDGAPGSDDAATGDTATGDGAPADGVPEGEELPGAQPTPELPESGLVDPPVEGFADAERVELEVPDDVFVRRISPDGTQLLVSAPDDEGVGCEEGPPASLQLRALGGGPSTRVLPPGSPDGLVLDAPGQRVLVVSGCEGFVFDAVVAEQLPDGALRVLQDVVLPGDDASVTALAPLDDGLVVARVGADGPELVTVGYDGLPRGDATALPQEAYQLWAASAGVFTAGFDMAQASEVLADARGELRLVGFDDADVSDDGTLLVATGDGGVRVVAADGSVATWVEDPLDDDVAWGASVFVAPDRVLALRDRFGASELVVVGPDGVVASIEQGVADLPRPSLSSDGTRLLYATVDPDSFESTHVVRVQR